MLGVLPGSARDLEHRRRTGQEAGQHLEDRCLVAVGGRAERHLFILFAMARRRRAATL